MTVVAENPHRGLRLSHMSHAISVRTLSSDMKKVDGFNAKIAVFLTNIVGSMWCAYVFAIIALLGLEPALKPGGEGLIAWIAQTFLQLVLLSVIMVGQSVQSEASDARAQRTESDAERIMDRLDIHTQGGITDIMAALDALRLQIEAK
jgi:hypothetical protein